MSHFNSCLLAFQGCKDPLVGGFKQWRTNGRQVLKGSSAYAIWVPIGKAKEGETTDDSDDKPGFILGNVFGISQTATLEEIAKMKDDEATELYAAEVDAHIATQENITEYAET